VGTSKVEIVEWVNRLLTKQDDYDAMAQSVNPYGDGKACQRIVAFLETASRGS
ncbi:MAG: UDP-N-acetylglucosamine 2-epimerase, partial [Oceanospirillaceae bacterium]|nr:UDP-N-acetylglucosamine 2-epimerase [Oceanospirillaceae bacterium]